MADPASPAQHSKPLRLAVLGAGNWSTAMHLPAFKKLAAADGVRFVAVCDRQEELAAAYAKELNAERTFADLAQMLAEARPDGLAVLVQPAAAAQVLETVIARGVPFIVEKPPAPGAAAHRKLRDAAGALPHVVAYNRRHCAYVAEALAWLGGETPQCVSCHFTRHNRRDRFDTTAVHAIDTVLHLAGGCFETLRAEVAPGGGVTNFFLNGWTERGTRVEIAILPNTGSAMEHYWVRGERRSALVSFPQRSMFDVPGYVELHEGNRVAARKGPEAFGLEAAAPWEVGGILGEHRHFVRVLRGEEQAYSTLAATLQTQEVRDALAKLLDAGPRGAAEVAFGT